MFSRFVSSGQDPVEKLLIYVQSSEVRPNVAPLHTVEKEHTDVEEDFQRHEQSAI